MSAVALGRKASSSGGTLSIDAVAERDLSCSSRNERRMKVSGQSHSSLLYLSLAQDKTNTPTRYLTLPYLTYVVWD